MKHCLTTMAALFAIIAIMGCTSEVKEAKTPSKIKPVPIRPAPSEQPAAPAMTLVAGKAAPEISAKDTDGEVFNLSDYRGKVVMLDFWGNW